MKDELKTMKKEMSDTEIDDVILAVAECEKHPEL